jgi:hypothetical protein
MARERYEDEDEEDTGRGRGRSRDDDDDYDDRPRRRGGSGDQSGLNGFFGNTATFILALVITFCCCSPFGIILGGIGAGTCTNPDAKRNALIVCIFGCVMLVVGIALQFTGALANLQK